MLGFDRQILPSNGPWLSCPAVVLPAHGGVGTGTQTRKGHVMRIAKAFALLLLVERAAFAGLWVEASRGDAGFLPVVAQETYGSGSLTEIIGYLNAGGGGGVGPGDTIDVFAIKITDPEHFSATVTHAPGPEISDTQLFLFDKNGFGVIANDDAEAGSGAVRFGSHLPAGHPASPQRTGLYYLAISIFDNDPVAIEGLYDGSGRIFLGAPPHREDDDPPFFYGTSGPDGPAGHLPIVSWDRFQTIGYTGPYTIRLTGATYATPEPTSLALLVLGAGAAVAARRRRPGRAELGSL